MKLQVQLAEPLAPAWLVMPSALARYWRTQAASSLNVHVLPLSQLSHSLLRATGQAKPLLTRSQRVQRLSQLMAAARSGNQSCSLPAPSQAPNLAKHVDSLIQELRQAGISVAEYQGEAKRTGGQREFDLACLFREYEKLLAEEGLWDGPSVMVQVCNREEDYWAAFKPPSYLGIAGYDAFTPLEQRFLAAVQQRIDHFEVYFPAGSDQSSRNVAAEMACGLDLSFPEQVLKSNQSERDASPIFVEAPTTEHEVRHVLRQIKRRHIEENIPLADFTVCLPFIDSYGPQLHSCADEYGLPLALERSLAFHPLSQTFKQLLYLYPDFSWQACWDVLESPFVKQSFLDDADLQDLRQITQGRITTGLKQWKTAMGWAANRAGRDGLPAERVASLQAKLEAFFAACQPPDEKNPREYLTWIANMLPDGGEAPLCLQLPKFPNLKEKTAGKAAWTQIQRTIDAQRIPAQQRSVITWAEQLSNFVDELFEQNLQIHEPARAVQVVSFHVGWNHPTVHLFALGMNEGALPRVPDVGPFYTHQERQDSPLPLSQFDSRQAQLRWSHLLANSTGQVTLSRPTSDVDLREVAPSPFWAATNTPIALSRSMIPPCPDAASLTELAAAMQDQRVGATAGKLLQRQRRATGLAEIVAARLSVRGQIGSFEGHLTQRDIHKALRYKFDLDTTWSPSSLQEYARCPLGFLAKRILGLKPEPQLATELDPLTRGLVLHDILNLVLEWVRDSHIEMTEANSDEISAQASAFTQRAWRDLQSRYLMHPYALDSFDLRQIETLVLQAVRLELEDSGWQPFLLEWRFGDGRPEEVVVRHEDKTWALPLRGIVDRIDKSEEGRLRVIDYKSRAGAYARKEMEAALNTQVLLYALVVDNQGWGAVSASGYRMLQDTEKSDLKNAIDWTEGPPDLAIAIEATLGRHQDEMRKGRFLATPPSITGSIAKCAEWCELAEFCQPSTESRLKAARAFSQ